MATTDSDPCRPLVPGCADHLFRRVVDHFSDPIGMGGRARSDSLDDLTGIRTGGALPSPSRT